MSVPSPAFLLFGLVGALLFNLFAAQWWRTGVLFAMNLALLHSLAPGLVPFAPLGGFLGLGYAGVLARRRQLRWARWFFPAAVLCSFVWLKRYSFVPACLWLPSGYVTIGLSYVFFRVMHVVVDGFHDLPEGPQGAVCFVNYTLNFTSFVSGPIQRLEAYRACDRQPAPLGLRVLIGAAERVMAGAFKVYIVSGLLAVAQSAQLGAIVAGQPWALQLREAALGVGLYPLYLYFNFAGYTDFVIGIACLFRIVLPENFDRPFSATSFIEFWTRWHITLSQWLRLYVYTPLLLAALRRVRRGPWRMAAASLAYFCTFFLVGVWHGQSSEFVLFGLLQGGGVAANALFRDCLVLCAGRGTYQRLAANAAYRMLCRGLTFTWFAFTLLWFWCSWPGLHHYGAVLGWPASLAVWPLIWAASTAILAAQDWVCASARQVPSRYRRTASFTAQVVVMAVAALIVSAPAPQLVYKSF